MILEFILFVLTILVGLVLYARWNYGTLEKMGIPVVKPHFLLGSTADSYKTVTHFKDYEWFKKYGNVFGVYEGRVPQVFVCDPDIIKHIMVSDYEHFHSRRNWETGDKIMNEALDFQKYGKWKALRSMTTPMFSTSRIKIMSKSINDTLVDYMKVINEELSSSGGEIKKLDLQEKNYNMNVDLAARSVFGLKIDDAEDPNNFLAKNLKEFMSPAHHRSSIFTTIGLTFRFIRSLTPIFDPGASNTFIRIFRTLVENRRDLQRKGEHQDNDLINNLIHLLDKVDTEEFKKDEVNEFSIMAQAVVFFMAGPDQFATTLTFLAYYLTTNLKAKKRLYEELDKFKTKCNGQILHENLHELVYTQACMQEVLRLMPPFIRPERICTKDWEYNGLKIKEGTLVIMPLWPTGRHPDYFEEPEEFRPERWLPENKSNMHPYAFMGFGYGPKNCIAMRYNYEVLYFSIAHLFSTYDFKARDDTKVVYRPGNLMMSSFEPIYFDVVKQAGK